MVFSNGILIWNFEMEFSIGIFKWYFQMEFSNGISKWYFQMVMPCRKAPRPRSNTEFLYDRSSRDHYLCHMENSNDFENGDFDMILIWILI